MGVYIIPLSHGLVLCVYARCCGPYTLYLFVASLDFLPAPVSSCTVYALVAILTDTAETLSRLHSCTPPILLATMEAKDSLSSDGFLTSFFTSTVSVRAHQASRVNWQRTYSGVDDEEGKSAWIAEMKLTHEDVSSETKSLNYMITSKFGENFRIIWKV